MNEGEKYGRYEEWGREEGDGGEDGMATHGVRRLKEVRDREEKGWRGDRGR